MRKSYNQNDAEPNLWECPICRKVLIPNFKGNAAQAKKIAQHLLTVHETGPSLLPADLVMDSLCADPHKEKRARRHRPRSLTAWTCPVCHKETVLEFKDAQTFNQQMNRHLKRYHGVALGLLTADDAALVQSGFKDFSASPSRRTLAPIRKA